MPFDIRGIGSEVVGIDDVAEAMMRASRRGRVGERYTVSERFMTHQGLVETAAAAVDARPPRFGIPMAVVHAVSSIGDAAAAIQRRDVPMSRPGELLFEYTSPASHARANPRTRLHPRPTEQFIRRAAENYVLRSGEPRLTGPRSELIHELPALHGLPPIGGHAIRGAQRCPITPV